MPSLEEGAWERERMLEALEAYRRGVSDAPLLRKWSGAEGRALEGDRGQQMTFVVSTDEVDRHGDVIVAQGWQIESYQRNPVFLWAHDYARPVIGRAAAVWREPDRLVARMEFAPTEFAREVAALYQGGYQRGVSVGFRPIQYEERRHEKTGAFLGIRFLEQELLEVSAVPVPANRSALRRALDQAPRLGDYLSRLEQQRQPAEARSDVEGIWPELAARVDDLGKLAGELAELLGSVEAVNPRVERSRGTGAGTQGADSPAVAAVLEMLRGARW
ncbi:MAG TPA: HK97 family phage prohead protease [Dehalococcoidia bacterium]|nr:HK97 family phage prohead protease [Dehalococcoidia bacterium]